MFSHSTEQMIAFAFKSQIFVKLLLYSINGAIKTSAKTSAILNGLSYLIEAHFGLMSPKRALIEEKAVFSRFQSISRLSSAFGSIEDSLYFAVREVANRELNFVTQKSLMV